ncbi:MAG: ABC transporter ATP-binding protein [Candidatus Nomurabacteria bacterium]|nr:ABC transporter ATP-binding protein [Candidatus Saccharibacteria bacterium]USN95822.1 MAG: ABC transporter ATP-binding protein [Candidatus Nomurabacteria bacterium]
MRLSDTLFNVQTTNSSLISVKNLSKVYGKKENSFKALKGVSLTINKGDSLAIIGKSGSGKSTLMHILACLDRPTSGTYLFEGKNVNKLKPAELDRLRNERFGFVFQQFFMNANDTVIDNVALPLKIAGVGKKERQKLALETLAQVDLKDKAKNRAKNLSGGQKQRVCIARALINRPDVLFADEPTGNLDSVTGAQVEDILFKLNKEHGITLIIVTHDDDLAKKCNKRVYIKDGLIKKDEK